MSKLFEPNSMGNSRDKDYLKSLLGSYQVHAAYPKVKGHGDRESKWPMNGTKIVKHASRNTPRQGGKNEQHEHLDINDMRTHKTHHGE